MTTKKLEKLIDIVSQYAEAKANKKAELEKLEKQYQDGLIASRYRRERTEKINSEFEKVAGSFLKQYQEEFPKAVEELRTGVSSPAFASDTGFQNVLQTIRNNDGVFDLEADVIRGMIAPYMDDYAARKMIANELDKHTPLKSSFFGIHTENPVFALEGIKGYEHMEFNPSPIFQKINGGLLTKLEQVLAIAKGESSEVPNTTIVF